MNTEALRQEILNTNGKWFSVVFTKKDGSLRPMTARTKVKKYLRGGVNPNPKIYTTQIVVWDRASKEYRTINLETVKEFTFKNKKVTF